MSDQKGGRAATPDAEARYDGIEGGAAPSPFASIFFAVAFAAAIAAAAIGERAHATAADLWILAAITAVVSVVIAVGASPSE